MAVIPSNPESVFTYGAPQLKFGPGASGEIGYDLAQYGARACGPPSRSSIPTSPSPSPPA
jgi:hypothetical protein